MINNSAIKNFLIKFLVNYIKISPLLITYWYFSNTHNQDPKMFFVLSLFTIANVLITLGLLKKET